MATALIPLNRFINVAKKITTDPQLVYTTPTEVSAIVLSAICTNRTSSEVTVNVALRKFTRLPGESQPTIENFSLTPDIPIPPNDVLSVVSSRLVLTNLILNDVDVGGDIVDGVEVYDALIVSASANDAVDLIMSINEAANE